MEELVKRSFANLKKTIVISQIPTLLATLNQQMYLFTHIVRIDKLLEILQSYDKVVLVVGLGGRGGDYLIKIAKSIRSTIIFVVKPSRVEKIRTKKAEKQLSMLKNAIIKELDKLIEKMPNTTLADALDTFDSKIAEEIASQLIRNDSFIAINKNIKTN